jgi:hypothetical protein
MVMQVINSRPTTTLTNGSNKTPPPGCKISLKKEGIVWKERDEELLMGGREPVETMHKVVHGGWRKEEAKSKSSLGLVLAERDRRRQVLCILTASGTGAHQSSAMTPTAKPLGFKSEKEYSRSKSKKSGTMVAYGDTLRRARRLGWEDAYLNYELLRSLLEEIENLCQSPAASSADDASSQVEDLEEQFLNALRREIEKVSLFTLSRQGEIADAVGALRFRNAANSLQIQPSPVSKVRPEDLEENVEEPSFSGEETALLPKGSIVLGPLKTPKPVYRKGQHQEEPRPMFRQDAVPFMQTTPGGTAADDYAVLGVELLHLLKFICVNAMGIRKILKKRDKIMVRAHQVLPRTDQDDDDKPNQRLVGGPEDHLQQLAYSPSIAAIHSSLLAELADLEAAESKGDVPEGIPYQAIEEGNSSNGLDMSQLRHYPASLVRFQCTVSSIHTLRDFALRVNEPYQVFLSNKAMILTGHDPGGLERTAQKALALLVRFQPDSLLLMNESDLRDWEKRLMKKTLRTLAADHDASIGDLNLDLESWGGVNSRSMIINLMSTLLYTVNYYIVAPTANHYAILLGTDGAFGATLVGASSFAAIFAAFLYSLWYTKSSFRSALLMSAVCPCLGNLLYAVAISYQSIQIAIWGRILVGFGSAEVVNRQLISACVSFRNMTHASALFVAAGAIGMSVGPLLAAILDMVSGRDLRVDLELPLLPTGGIIYNHVTSPGFVMASLWFLEILALVFLFCEPERINGSGHDSKGDSAVVSFDSDRDGDATDYGTSDFDKSQKSPRSRRKSLGNIAWTQLVLVKKLIFSNMALPVTLLLFGFIELTDEVLISSCSMVVRRYFNWNGSKAGFLLASLGALVLPAHYVVERASHRYSERKIMKVSEVQKGIHHHDSSNPHNHHFISQLSVLFIFACLFAILNYEGLIFDLLGLLAEGVSASTDQIQSVNGTTYADISIGGTDVQKILNKEGEVPYDWGYGKPVYIVFLSAIFMGTIILEGVDTSIMSKATPAKLNDTFINSGLLATLVGTVGRVLGDSMITFSALVDQDIFTDFVNATFFPMAPLAFIGYVLIRRFYSSLR